jgi:putative FmdB family regulatory protein
LPIYDYRCSSCGQRTEVIHGIHESGPRFCPNCGAEGTLRKAITSPAILFKGSGWAKKDRAATRTPAAAKTGGDAAKPGSAATDGSSGGTSAGGTPGTGSSASGSSSDAGTAPASGGSGAD